MPRQRSWSVTMYGFQLFDRRSFNGQTAYSWCLAALLGGAALSACAGDDRDGHALPGSGGEAGALTPPTGDAGESNPGVGGAAGEWSGAGDAGHDGAGVGGDGAGGGSAGEAGAATAGAGMAGAGLAGEAAGGASGGALTDGGAAGGSGGCPEGYERDGERCTDVDECANSAEPACGGHAVCENTPGAFTCACPPGWVGDPAQLCCPEARPAAEPASIALSIGHVDVLAMSYDCQGGGGIELATRDDSAGLGEPVFRSVESTLIHATVDASMLTLPEGFEFLGPEGAPIYIFPETFVETMVWPGWDSNGVPRGVFDDDELTLVLNSVEGPGEFIGFVFADVPIIVFDTQTAVDRTTVSASTHAHMNWAFTSPGLYELSFTVEAVRNGSSTSANALVRFFIGELAELPETEPTVVGIEGLLSSYHLGDTLALQAIRYGAPVSFETHWLRQCPVDAMGGNFDVTPWSEIATGEALSHTLVASDLACQYRAVLMDELGAEHATSQNVQPAVAWPEG